MTVNHKIYNIFLCSSSELYKERDTFILAVNQFCKNNPQYRVNFNVIRWEDFAASYEDARKQDAYNKAINESDVFVMMYWTKVGMFSMEEYRIAQQSLIQNKKPLLLLIKKNDGAAPDESVALFENSEVNHGNGLFNPVFSNETELKLLVLNELQKLFRYEYLKTGEPATLLSLTGIENPAVFIGREEELMKIRNAMSQRGSSMMISAEGGLGKTTLAAKYWYDSLYNYKYNAWLYCGKGIWEALKTLAYKLDVNLSDLKKDQQLVVLKNALSAIHHTFLLVLDNVNDEKEIRWFKREFEGFHWNVLITSRSAGILSSDSELKLEHLSPALSKKLFRTYYSEDEKEEETLLDKVLSALNYHTLLIEIFAKNMKKASLTGLSLNEFLEKLEKKGLYLGDYSFDVQSKYTDYVRKKAETTDEILNILYDFSILNEDERLLLINTAILPAESYAVKMLLELLCDNDLQEKKNAIKTLENLYHSGWLSGSVNENYRISPVIQLLVLNKNSQTLDSDTDKLINRFKNYLKPAGLTVNIDLLIACAGAAEHINKYLKPFFTENTAHYLYYSGIFFHDRGDLRAMYCCVESCDILKQQITNKPGNYQTASIIADLYCRLGNITHHDLGNTTLAKQYYDYFFKFCSDFYEKYPAADTAYNLAKAYKCIGVLAEDVGDFENAIIYYRKNLELLEKINVHDPLGKSYKLDLASAYELLSRILIDIGEYDSGEQFLKKHWQLSKENYETNTADYGFLNNYALSCIEMGKFYSEKRDINSAISFLEVAKEILHQGIKDNNRIISSIEYNLAYAYALGANIFSSIDDDDKAYEQIVLSNKFAETIYNRSPFNLANRNLLALNYARLGRILFLRGQTESAMKFLSNSFDMISDVCNLFPENVSYLANFGTILLFNGEVFEKMEQYENAQRFYADNLIIMQRIEQLMPESITYQENLAVAYSRVAGIFNKLRNSETAIINYEYARKILLKLTSSQINNIKLKKKLCLVYDFLANTHFSRNESALAIENFETAIEITTGLHDENPSDHSLLKELAHLYSRLALVYKSINDEENTIQSFIICSNIYKTVYDGDNSINNKRIFSRFCLELGFYLMNLNQSDIDRTNNVITYLSYACKNYYEICKESDNINDIHDYSTSVYNLTDLAKSLIELKMIARDGDFYTDMLFYRRDAANLLQSIPETDIISNLLRELKKELCDESWYNF